MSQSRKPKGTPIGGQFAGKSNPESELTIDDDRPRMQIGPDGTEVWRLDGQRHRTDGPAVIYPGKHQAWYQYDQLHRLDGPAVVWSNGSQAWFLNGKHHRSDGPAVINSDGTQEWWVNGEHVDPPV